MGEGSVEVYIIRPSANLNIKWAPRKSKGLNFGGGGVSSAEVV